MEQINETVKAQLDDHFETLVGIIGEREAEIARINAAPKTRSVGKARYEPCDPNSPEAVVIAEKINAGAYTHAGIDFEVGHGVVRKVAAVKGEKVVSGLGAIDARIKTTIDAMKQVALAQKPSARTSGGSGGSHAITKAWFEAHQNECPAGMAVAWDDQTNKITYNLPKGGRGATVSHGALNNIVKAYGGRSAEPVEQPIKEIPKKVGKKGKK